MENTRKKRGISLSHHSSRPQPQPEQTSCPITTRLQYVRYPITPNIPRQASAPKPKINFNYTINHASYFQQNASACHSSFVGEDSYIVQSKANLLEKCSLVTNKNQDVSIVEQTQTKAPEIAVHYDSFQHCKEVLERRLFGTNQLSNSKLNVQHSSRVNSFRMPQIEQFNTSLAHINDNTPNKSKMSPKNLPKPLQRPLEDSRKINSLPIEEPKQRESQREANKTLKNGKNVQSQGEQQRQEALVLRKQKGKQKKDPIKLQEMQRRLLEIIKICDQNA